MFGCPSANSHHMVLTYAHVHQVYNEINFFSKDFGLQTNKKPLRLILTPTLLLQAPQTLFLPPPGLFGFLVLPTLVEILHHHPYKHVEHEEADDE